MFKFLSLFLLAPAFLLADAGEAAKGSQMWQTLIMIGLAVVFFYFILWRPEQKRRKTMQKQRESLKKGDRVTAMGIVGTLSKVQEKTIILTMVDGAKIEILKAAITDVQPAATVEEAEKPSENNA